MPEDDEPTGNTDTEISVEVGGSVTGAIEQADDIDSIAVTLTAGVTYQIDLEGIETGEGTLDDPFLLGLFDANIVRVADADDDDGVGRNSRILFTPDETGTYFIGVAAFSTGTGTYTLFVEEEALSTRPDPDLVLDTVELTGNPLIDGLGNGTAWPADADGTTTLTYSIPAANSVFPVPFVVDGVDLTASFTPASAEAVSLFRGGLDFIEAIADIRFEEVTDAGTEFGTLRLFATTATNEALGTTLGVAELPDDGATPGDIYLFEFKVEANLAFFEFATGLTPGSINGLQFVTLHEAGHALGLKHPGEGRTAFPDAFFGVEYTLMVPSFASAFFPTAFISDFGPTTFGYADILALRHLYGEVDTASGDDTYTFDLSERYFETIFDTGGTDTIRIVGEGGGVNIDLRPDSSALDGTWIDVGTTVTYYNAFAQPVGARTETVFLTPETVIENVITSSGDDWVVGNSADNRLEGMDGDDQLFGGAGSDILHGGAGNDDLFGGAGDDVITGDDFLSVVGDDDQIGGGAGDDQLWGKDGDDTLYGGSGSDTIYGGAGADLLFNGAGDDVLQGGAGDDTLWGGAGRDVLIGGAGADVFIFGANSGSDVITDFDLSQDILDLSLLGLADFAAFEASASAGDDGVTLSVAGNEILLAGLTLDDLSAVTLLL